MGLEGEGSGGRGGGKWGERGREVGLEGEGSGDWVPPVHPLIFSCKYISTLMVGCSNFKLCRCLDHMM